jgi:hypothetical protein
MNEELAWGVSSEIFEGNKKRRIERRLFKPGSEPEPSPQIFVVNSLGSC